jgi:predicted glutamine amidotransferase
MKHSFLIVQMFILLLAMLNVSAQEAGYNFGSWFNIENQFTSFNDSAHECRFWGMIAAEDFNYSTKALHLASLKHLGSDNPNGWGIGFYTKTLKGGFIPVTYRGMWRADQDYLYDVSAGDMLDNLSGCGVAHVRRSSSGYVNIPDPHPFCTRSLTRDFTMLFGHNGTLDKPTLIEMLGDYTHSNHYSYSGEGVNDPNLDSDLYRLYLMKWIDEHPSKSITSCLASAIVHLTTEMGTELAYNFVMASNYDTLWALRYNYSLYYRREVELSGYVWEVASQALSETGWIKASNFYLYAFTPGKATPDSIPVKDMGWGLPENAYNNSTISFGFPNPASGNTLKIEIKARESQLISFQLFGSQGQVLSAAPNIAVDAGTNHFIFDIGYLKAGIYYVRMEAGENSQTKKMIVIGGNRGIQG